jgi:hypothetical protein
MPRRFSDRDYDCLPVMVPRSDKRLVPLTPERVERLRQHLREALLDLGKARRLDRFAAPISPEPTGFSAIVARAACSLCEGWCCWNGGDEAFLDDRTLARLRLTNPKITEQADLSRPGAGRRLPRLVHFSRQARLLAGSVDAGGYLQHLLLRRPSSIHEKPH